MQRKEQITTIHTKNSKEIEGHVVALFMVPCGMLSMFIVFITILNFDIILLSYLITEF